MCVCVDELIKDEHDDEKMIICNSEPSSPLCHSAKFVLQDDSNFFTQTLNTNPLTQNDDFDAFDSLFDCTTDESMIILNEGSTVNFGSNTSRHLHSHPQHQSIHRINSHQSTYGTNCHQTHHRDVNLNQSSDVLLSSNDQQRQQQHSETISSVSVGNANCTSTGSIDHFMDNDDDDDGIVPTCSDDILFGLDSFDIFSDFDHLVDDLHNSEHHANSTTTNQSDCLNESAIAYNSSSHSNNYKDNHQQQQQQQQQPNMIANPANSSSSTSSSAVSTPIGTSATSGNLSPNEPSSMATTTSSSKSTTQSEWQTTAECHAITVTVDENGNLAMIKSASADSMIDPDQLQRQPRRVASAGHRVQTDLTQPSSLSQIHQLIESNRPRTRHHSEIYSTVNRNNNNSSKNTNSIAETRRISTRSNSTNTELDQQHQIDSNQNEQSHSPVSIADYSPEWCYPEGKLFDIK